MAMYELKGVGFMVVGLDVLPDKRDELLVPVFGDADTGR